MAMNKLYLKAVLFMAIIGAVIISVDQSGMFNPDMTSFHEKLQWDSFYDFTRSNDVDVLLVGNSHLYTGINPNHLSCALGANCFILASPGTTITDSYYALKEGLTKCDPKVVVVETYGISSTRVRDLTGGDLTSQFRSFSSRKNILKKLVSTPVLFSPDNYLSAWSSSVRGHDMIFRDPDQIKKNLDGKNVPAKKKDLELGRFTRFITGISDATDKEYDEKGAVVDGNDFKVNRENFDSVRKIQRLCDRKGIRVVFLTLPMYHKHVENYSTWHTIISRVIGLGYDYLDLQQPYDHEVFTKECFEDTRNANQHMTAQGALMADYKLASFLVDKIQVDLPHRYQSEDWHRLFYGENGYLENYPLDPNDNRNFPLSGKANVGGISILNCAFVPYDDGSQVFMRIDKRTDPALLRNGLELYVNLEMRDGRIERYKIPVRKIKGIEPLRNQVLESNVLPITGVKSASLSGIARLVD